MTRISRRSFLGGLGAAALAAPFLPAWIGRADTVAAPKRFVIFWTPNGLYEPEWTPRSGFALGRILEPCAAFRDRLLVLKNLDWQSYFADPASPANDHPPPLSHGLCATDVVDYEAGRAGVGDAWGGGPSIDQLIAQRVGGETPFESLVTTVESGARRTRLSYRAAREHVPPIADPVAVFDRLFAGADLDDTAIERLRAERRSVLDVVSTDLAALSARIGRDDAYKIEAHLTHVRALEERIAREADLRTCVAPDLSTVESPHTFVRHGRQHMDLVATALACDLTRVAFLEWDGAQTTHSWAGVSSSHHTYAHYNAGISTEANSENLIRIGEWYGEQFAYLLERLDAIPEGDGTVLDNTVVLWTSEHKAGANSGAHNRRDVPFLIAGGAGHFRTGQVVDCRGAAHNDLYVSICHALGLTDISTFGNRDVCAGPLSGVT